MNNIIDILGSMNGTTFLGIDTETPVKLKGGKKNILQGRVTKRVVGSNVQVFQNKYVNGYENMVNRNLVEEGKDEFHVGPRQWGVRIDNTPFVEHKGQIYLEVIFKKAGTVEVLLDGQVVDPSTIEGYPESKSEGHQGGADKKVIIRTYKLENITSIRADHQEYKGVYYDSK